MYDIRLVGPKDQAQPSSPWRQLLHERLPGTDIEARLRWIYRGNPAGEGLAWIAHEPATGEPAGMTTFFPRRMWVDGEVIQGAIGGDMYVRPSFRRRGIGRELFLAARRDMAQLGISLMFGTPMPPNVTALVSSGSTVPCDSVVRYARVLGTRSGRLAFLPRPVGALLDPLLAGRRDHRLRLEPITPVGSAGSVGNGGSVGSPDVDAQLDALWAETRGELSIATIRDAEFYRWRFVDSPSQKQKAYLIFEDDRPIAACALEVVESKLRVVDLLAPQKRWRTALKAIAASANGETGLELRLARADARRRAASLYGSALLPRETAPMSMLTPETAEGARLAPRLHDPSRWFLTWADTDIDHV